MGFEENAPKMIILKAAFEIMGISETGAFGGNGLAPEEVDLASNSLGELKCWKRMKEEEAGKGKVSP